MIQHIQYTPAVIEASKAALAAWQWRQIEFATGCGMIFISFTGIMAWCAVQLAHIRNDQK